jgi:transposase InsO family protein
MSSTIFPVLPREVAVLSTGEFAFDMEGGNAPSLDDVCRRFENDANRALVWLIRSRALKAWCAADGIAAWLTAARRPHIGEVAASFELNDRWEFDADRFCHAVDTIANRASRQ